MNKGKKRNKKNSLPIFEKDCYSYFTYKSPTVNSPFKNQKLNLSLKLEIYGIKCVKIQFSPFEIGKTSIKIGIWTFRIRTDYIWGTVRITLLNYYYYSSQQQLLYYHFFIWFSRISCQCHHSNYNNENKEPQFSV